MMLGSDNMPYLGDGSFDELNYANLSEKQEKELRSFEKKFNEEFGSAFCFMVVDRPNHTSPN